MNIIDHEFISHQNHLNYLHVPVQYILGTPKLKKLNEIPLTGNSSNVIINFSFTTNGEVLVQLFWPSYDPVPNTLPLVLDDLCHSNTLEGR